ncbi:MAG: VRR-NUC domain-containing protein [Chloroflexi bacterium]|nr:VRR-NUC domain-containing protein [Chloroflexota bacterium]
MVTEIVEKVIYYPKEQLEAWKQGDKRLVPEFVNEEERKQIRNQPKYHFGEIFALRHYQREGWLGCFSYALGDQYLRSQARKVGREKVKEIIPKGKLKKFLAISCETRNMKFGTGEPDLFLYKPNGEYKFVEVKKQTDKIRSAQRTCIAQILASLDCKVDIVFLCEEGHQHNPKTYAFDLD